MRHFFLLTRKSGCSQPSIGRRLPFFRTVSRHRPDGPSGTTRDERNWLPRYTALPSRTRVGNLHPDFTVQYDPAAPPVRRSQLETTIGPFTKQVQ